MKDCKDDKRERWGGGGLFLFNISSDEGSIGVTKQRHQILGNKQTVEASKQDMGSHQSSGNSNISLILFLSQGY